MKKRTNLYFSLEKQIENINSKNIHRVEDNLKIKILKTFKKTLVSKNLNSIIINKIIENLFLEIEEDILSYEEEILLIEFSEKIALMIFDYYQELYEEDSDFAESILIAYVKSIKFKIGV